MYNWWEFPNNPIWREMSKSLRYTLIETENWTKPNHQLFKIEFRSQSWEHYNLRFNSVQEFKYFPSHTHTHTIWALDTSYILFARLDYSPSNSRPNRHCFGQWIFKRVDINIAKLCLFCSSYFYRFYSSDARIICQWCGGAGTHSDVMRYSRSNNPNPCFSVGLLPQTHWTISHKAYCL